MQRLQENKNWHWISPLSTAEKPSGEFHSDEKSTEGDEVARLFWDSTPEWKQENIAGVLQLNSTPE